jgi:protein-tyrosine phosphatase
MNRFPASRAAFSLKLAGALAIALAGSGAQAAPPAEPAVERQGGDTLVVTWRARGPVDVLVADRADAPLRSARLVSARDGDGKAVIDHAGAARRYVVLRDVRSGDMVRVAERALPLEAGSNFRDVGGYPAAGGRHVRWGLIYRSGATPLLTQSDRQTITGLGLKNMVDLRSDEERVLAPTRIDGVPYTAVGYSMTGLMSGLGTGGGMELLYRRLPETMVPQLRQIFARLLRNEGPIVYNCSAGQDRTGFVTAVILSALGTPWPVIVSDYHLSTKFRRPEFEMPPLAPAQQAGSAAGAMFAQFQSNPNATKAQPLKTAAGVAYLDFAFAELKAKWGGVNGYLAREIGITPRDTARLRALYTQ